MESGNSCAAKGGLIFPRVSCAIERGEHQDKGAQWQILRVHRRRVARRRSGRRFAARISSPPVDRARPPDLPRIVRFAQVGVETRRQWADNAITRTTPALLGFYSLVSLWACDLPPRTHGERAVLRH